MSLFKRWMSRLSLGLGLALITVAAQAQADSPVGLWRNIDDKTGESKGLIRITENGGALTGRIEAILTKGQEDARCEHCEGDLKDKPVKGMTILQGLRKDKDHWDGGTVLDPNNGKFYKARLKLIEGGKKLELRGYIGTPLLGRTQTWIRE